MTRAWCVVVVLEALAAASAWLVSRQARAHRLVTWTLCLGLACDVVGRVLVDRCFEVPGPYTGSRRLAFHLTEIAFTAYPAAFAALALFVGTGRAQPARTALAVWALFLAVCVGGYPWLRGESRLGLAYLLAQVAVVGAGVAAARAVWRCRVPLTTTHAVVFALFLAEVAHLVGPFLSSPFKDWHYAQIAYSLAFGAALLIHLEALWTTRRCSPSSV